MSDESRAQLIKDTQNKALWGDLKLIAEQLFSDAHLQQMNALLNDPAVKSDQTLLNELTLLSNNVNALKTSYNSAVKSSADTVPANISELETKYRAITKQHQNITEKIQQKVEGLETDIENKQSAIQTNNILISNYQEQNIFPKFAEIDTKLKNSVAQKQAAADIAYQNLDNCHKMVQEQMKPYEGFIGSIRMAFNKELRSQYNDLKNEATFYFTKMTELETFRNNLPNDSNASQFETDTYTSAVKGYIYGKDATKEIFDTLNKSLNDIQQNRVALQHNRSQIVNSQKTHPQTQEIGNKNRNLQSEISTLKSQVNNLKKLEQSHENLQKLSTAPTASILKPSSK